MAKGGESLGCMVSTYVHFKHVLQDIVTELLAGKAGQLVCDHELALARDVLVMLLIGQSLLTGMMKVIFHKESLARLEA
jgi:hypothetical protein